MTAEDLNREIAEALGVRVCSCPARVTSQVCICGLGRDYPAYDTDEIFWPAFEKWLKSTAKPVGINGLYAKYEVFVDGSGSLRIMDFNTDKTVGHAETNSDPNNRVTLAEARCKAWLSALKLTAKESK
jgi:hypothetical protein